MTQREDLQDVMERLHAARVRGDLTAACRLFADHGQFQIAGASADKPISIRADTMSAFRPWLSMMFKVFRIQNYELTSLIIDPPRVAVHWRADIYSMVTGVVSATELIDLVEIRDGAILSYNEFFVPR